MADRPVRDAIGQSAAGHWSAGDLRQELGLAGRVWIEGDDMLPGDDCVDAAMERLACLDIHLMPHHLADVEPIVLAACSMGVATVTTRFGAAEELLGEAVRLVPPGVVLDDPAGHHIAIMDIGRGVWELLHLARDPETRRALGAAARARMRGHDEAAIVARWAEHIEALSASEPACHAS